MVEKLTELCYNLYIPKQYRDYMFLSEFGKTKVDPSFCLSNVCSDAEKHQCKFLSTTIHSMICILYNGSDKTTHYTNLQQDHRCERCVSDHS